MTDYVLNSPDKRVNNQYRFIAHDLLLERDISGEAIYAWAFARGVQVESTGQAFVTDNPGQDYTAHVAVARQKLGNDHTGDIQRFPLNAKETDEPLSLVRMNKTGGVALVSLAWSDDDLVRVGHEDEVKNPPRLKIWQFPQHGGVPAPDPDTYLLPSSVKNGFIDIPPIIARLSTLNYPVLIITHVGDNRWSKNNTALPVPPGENNHDLLIDFDIVNVITGSEKELEKKGKTQVQCRINLNEQLEAKGGGVLKERAYRIKYGMYNKNLEEKYNAATLPLIKSDLAQRWRMSQVIASERTSDDISRPALALTVVFHGFPGMSFQILLRPAGNKFKYIRKNINPDFLNGCSAT